MKDIVRQVLVLLSTIGVIVVNGLASTLPLNNLTMGEIASRFDVHFIPEDYTFAIWGLIYVALIAYSIYQLLPSQRENLRQRSTGWLYVLSCITNVAWLFLWHYEYFAFTLVAMVALLLLLISIYLRLGTGRTRVSAAESWLLRVPFSIYLGWITVATIANATSLLDYLNWNGWLLSPEAWAAIMLAAAALIASAVSVLRGDIAYVLVIVWAYVGIAIKHSDTALVAILAGFLAGFVLGTLLLGVPLAAKHLDAQPVGAGEQGARDRW